MQFFKSSLFRGTVWNTISFVFVQGVRFATNLILTRIFAPEMLGIMLIVNTLRIGAELISDIGVGQNVIHNPNAEEPRFYNTVYTMQAVRGAVIWAILVAGAWPVASFYKMQDLLWILPVTGIVSFFGGVTSLEPEYLKREMRYREFATYEIMTSLSGALIIVTLSYLYPNIWSLVISNVISAALNVFISFRIRTNKSYKFSISKDILAETRNFTKWIFVSSLIYFFSTNLDKLFFAKAIPLKVLGVYGIAKTLADLISTFSGRLGWNVLFPYIASHGELPRAELRAKFGQQRVRFLMLAAFGVAVAVTGSDLFIRLVYDQRYHDATWMLPLLLLGSWFSILATVNEAALLGLGRPSNVAASNFSKLVLLGAGLPLVFGLFGFIGAALIISFADLPRFFMLTVGAVRGRFSFLRQDFALTVVTLALVVAFELMRWAAGFGTSLDLVGR